MNRWSLAVSLAAITSFLTPARAQVQDVWSTTVPTSGFPTQTFVATDSVVDAFGVTYLAGYSFNAGNGSMWTARLDSAGNQVWLREHVAQVGFAQIAISPVDGSICVAGSLSPPGSYLGQGELHLVKYDPSGNLLWVAQPYYGPSTGQTYAYFLPGRGLEFDAAGNVYLCGTTATASQILSFGDAVVLSYDPLGALRFEYFVQGPGGHVDIAGALVSDGSGGFFVAGTLDAIGSEQLGTSTFLAHVSAGGTVSSVTALPFLFGEHTRFVDLAVDGSGHPCVVSRDLQGFSTAIHRVTRFDPFGQPILTVQMAPQLYATAVGAAADGRIAIVGVRATTNYPIFVQSLDSNLIPTWDRDWSAPGATQHVFDHIAIDTQGDIVVAGKYGIPAFGTEDAACVRFDASGNFRWERIISGAPNVNESVKSIRLMSQGRVSCTSDVRPLAGPTPYRTQVTTLSPDAHSFCHGDGTAVPCPCGNTSRAIDQSGCANSTGQAARLTESGHPSIANDTLVMTCSGMTPSGIALLVQGSNAVQPFAFGDGLRCFAGGVTRLYVRTASGGVVSVPGAGDPSILARSTSLGSTIGTGTKRVYQVYYRDSSPSFCPSPTGGSFNFSNALLVTWTP